MLQAEIEFNFCCCELLCYTQYVETHEDPDVTNTTQSRTYPSIYLGPTTNIQGTKKVFDLVTGVVKNPRSVTPFPMPDRAINIVNAWDQDHKAVLAYTIKGSTEGAGHIDILNGSMTGGTSAYWFTQGGYEYFSTK